MLLLADKLAIGLLILFAGLWVNRALESFKSGLNRSSKEHEIRFGKLHEQRAVALTKIYPLLHEARVRLGALELAIEQKSDEAELNRIAKSAADACEQAYNLLNENRLYFTWELAHSADEVLHALHIAAASYEFPRIRSQALENWGERKEKITSLMAKIENDFRALLGTASK